MDWLPALFDGWGSLGRIVLVGVPLYLLMLLMLQGFGKHALAKSNAYGLVVTVSLGSAMASAVLTKNVSRAEVLAAVRKHGIGCAEPVAAMVLEEDGTFSVIPDTGPQPSALAHVHDVEQHDVSPRELLERVDGDPLPHA